MKSHGYPLAPNDTMPYVLPTTTSCSVVQKAPIGRNVWVMIVFLPLEDNEWIRGNSSMRYSHGIVKKKALRHHPICFGSYLRELHG